MFFLFARVLAAVTFEIWPNHQYAYYLEWNSGSGDLTSLNVSRFLSATSFNPTLSLCPSLFLSGTYIVMFEKTESKQEWKSSVTYYYFSIFIEQPVY